MDWTPCVDPRVKNMGLNQRQIKLFTSHRYGELHEPLKFSVQNPMGRRGNGAADAGRQGSLKKGLCALVTEEPKPLVPYPQCEWIPQQRALVSTEPHPPLAGNPRAGSRGFCEGRG